MPTSVEDEIPVKRIVFWVAVVAIVIAVCCVGGWLISVAVSGPVGKLNQEKQVNSPQNRTAQYNKFFDENATYQTDLTNVQIAQTALKNFNAANPPGTPDPLGQINQNRSADLQNITGAQQICESAANTYNNDSAKTVTGAQFKSWDLPETLDPNACLETK